MIGKGRSGRIAIFMPRSTPFYMATLFAMKRGFEQHGFEVFGWTDLLERDALLEFCRQFRPDFLLEMNRSRNQIPCLPKSIIHIAWIVDLLGRPLDSFRDSEIIYFFGEHWVERYNRAPAGLIDWLPPGFCPECYFREAREPVVDFSFIGHIPLPWKQDELERVVWRGDDGHHLKFGELYEMCKAQWHTVEIHQDAEKIVADLTGKTVDIDDDIIRYDVSCRTGRMLNRQNMMGCVLAVSSSVRIYGPENWRAWPKYASYYIKFLADPHEIRKAILASKISVHEGLGMHFRLFDCMGTGACVFYYQNPNKTVFSGIETFFEPGKHYVPFDREDIEEKARFYLAHPKARKKIGQEAFKVVHADHKWSDRAAKIIRDLRRVGIRVNR